MKTLCFVVEEHKDYGEKGYRPKWQPSFDPLGGMSVAHDTLEHFPNDDGSTEGELMALGAAMFIRADGGWSSKYRHFDEVRDVSGDFVRLWELHEYTHNRHGHLSRPPQCRDADTRSRCGGIIEEAMRLCRGEWNDGGPQVTKEMWTHAAGWLAHGYMKARKRYRGLNACSVASIFKDIEEEAERLLQRADEGAELRVSVNLRRSSVRVHLVEPWELEN